STRLRAASRGRRQRRPLFRGFTGLGEPKINHSGTRWRRSAPEWSKVGIVEMHLFTKAVAAAALVAAPVLPLQLAAAGVGDLLVAPTRLVLNGGRSAEVILNNIGEEPATYRISAEFRRMNPDGTLEEVAEPTQTENAARDMLIFAPRRVTLAPREP